MKPERNPTPAFAVQALVSLAKELGHFQSTVAHNIELATLPETELRSEDAAKLRAKLLELQGSMEALRVEMFKAENREHPKRVRVSMRPVNGEHVASGVEMATKAVESIVEMRRRMA